MAARPARESHRLPSFGKARSKRLIRYAPIKNAYALQEYAFLQ